MSNINHSLSKGLAKQLAENGRDSWEIEITGGPLIERNSDPNYNYTDLVDSFWPASLAAIQYYTNKITTDYVGHSNGCRVALSSLEKYQTTGKSSVAKVQDLQTGNTVTVNLQGSSSTPVVNTFVGVGCPGALQGESRFITKAREGGEAAIQTLTNQGLKHVTSGDYAQIVDPTINFFIVTGDILTPGPAFEISLELLKFYNDVAISTQDNFVLFGLNINKTYLITGRYTGLFSIGANNDIIVPINDSTNIKNMVTSNTEDELTVSTTHNSLPDNLAIKSFIKEVLK